jgi:O-antigen/teichoic acid export membrane protein
VTAEDPGAARRTAASAGGLFLVNVFVAVLGIAQAVLAARWLGARLFGFASLIVSFASLLFLLFDARSRETAVRFIGAFRARNADDRIGVYCRFSYVLDLVVAVAAVGLIAALSPWAARNVVHDPGAWPLIVVFAAALVPNATVTTSSGVLVAARRMSHIAGVEAAAAVVSVGLVLTLVSSGRGIGGFVAGLGAGMALRGGLYVLAAIAAMRSWGVSLRDGRWSDLADDRRSILRFLFYNQLNAALGAASRYADIVLVGYYRGPTEAGYLRGARAAGDRIDLALWPLAAAIYPQLVELREAGRKDEFWRTVRRMVRVVVLPIALAGAIAVLLMPEVVPRILGPSFVPAVATVQLVVAATFWRAMFFWMRPVFLASDALRRYSVLLGATAAGLLVAWWLVIPRHGHVGAATVLLAGTILQTVAGSLLASREPRESHNEEKPPEPQIPDDPALL